MARFGLQLDSSRGRADRARGWDKWLEQQRHLFNWPPEYEICRRFMSILGALVHFDRIRFVKEVEISGPMKRVAVSSDLM